MPFNFLKKSRHYNVTSKSLFVISVHHLLDTTTTVDCTLSSESTGQECLDNVCQRLQINQTEFFGLRYLLKNTKDELRWIDLERPLSRQLEKYAAGPKIYLHVMYYVTSGVKLLEDEATRYYYFLQLKSDVADSRITCDAKEAILLALIIRQAEYDSYEKDKHTLAYIKSLLPFSRLSIEENVTDNLIEEVQEQNKSIQSLTQSQAEESYIERCQQMDGYGQEKIWAKDSAGNEVHLGITVNGIVIIYPRSIKFFPWYEVQNVINLKRTFNIEQSNNTVSFTFPEAEIGRYFWRLCVLQHTFYMKYENNQLNEINNTNQRHFFQNLSEDVTDSREDLLMEQQRNVYSPEIQQSMTGGGGIGITNSIMSSNISLATSQQQARTPVGQSWANIPQEYASSNSNFNFLIDPLDNRIQSTSCLDLSNNNYTHDRERLKALLPTYRPAPDYETAMQQKYRSSSNDIHMNPQMTAAAAARVPSNSIAMMADINYYSSSQPDVHNVTGMCNDGILMNHMAPHRYPDVAQTAALQSHLNSNVYSNIDLAQRLQMLRIKPPPQYPANRLSSTSTPDLAVASHRTLLGYRAYVSGSSPDLVSNRNMLNYPYLNHPMGTSQPYLPHGTFDNLNMIEEQPSIILPLRTPINSIQTQQPSVPQPPQPMYRHQQSSNGILHKTAMNGSIEPIYENVPLPRYGPEHSNEMRNRTSSIQSAPGGIHQDNQYGHLPNDLDVSSNGVHHIQMINHNRIEAANDILIQRNPHKIVHPMSSNPSLHREELMKPMQKESQPTPTPPPPQLQHQHKQPQKNNLSKTTSDIIPPIKYSDDHLSLMNSSKSSQSTSFLTSSQCSSFTTANTTLESGNTTSSTTSKEKRKKRWGILGRSKNSAEKQKSATLGREKKKDKNKVELSQEEANLRHRWSTGLPRLQPLSATYSKDKLCQILDSKLNDSQLFMEFERIPKRRESARYNDALTEENKFKNSDPNFLPYDENRVRITPTMDNRMGYVNASHISATVGSNQRFYIIAQSPHDQSTINIFWQCIWEADVYLIVQLSEDLNYIPPTPNKRLEFGQFQLYQEFSQKTERCITSKLRLYHIQSRRYRSVWHLNYTDWIEQNCPRDVGYFLDFLEELNSVRLASINEVPPGHNTNPPVLIHCREGGGRSGVTLTADLLLYTIDHNQDLDIPRVIGELRQQRDSIIPSLAQYKFIYSLLITYLKRTRLI